MTSLRILQVCPYAWDAPGGVQVHVGQLAEQLRGRGHDVRVVTPALHPRAIDEDVFVAGRAMRIPYQGTVAPICLDPASVPRVGRVLRSFAPDVVHVHEPIAPSVGMVAAVRSRSPVVATFHAFADRSRLLDVAAPALRPVWRRLAARIAVSETAAGFMRARFRDGIEIVPNGIDLDPYKHAQPADLPGERRLLWVGRLDRQKGFPVAVRAFEELARSHPELWFVVVGEGRDRDAVRSLSAPARERVVLRGTVRHEEVPAYYAAADAFVAPALGQETFGYVLVEAMAAGVPVVASDIPGYDEVVRDGENGLLVPPGDPRALAAAVERVLADSDLAARLTAAGLARAAEFSWDRVVTRIESIYDRVRG